MKSPCFFPPSPSARTASTGPGHLSRISAERLQPFGGLRTQVTGSRPPTSAAWWGMKKPTGWIWMGDTLRGMIWYVCIYIWYIYMYVYIYIQIWNDSYLYMSSCHVDNAMVITTKSCQQPGSMNGKRPFYMVESCSTNIFDDRRLQRILGHVSQEITLKKIPSNSIPLIPCYILSIIPMMSV